MEKNFNRKDFMLALNKAKRLTTEQFIEKAKQIYGDRFDYSKTEYINATTKLTITCRIHGDFKVLPQHHIRKDNSAKTGCKLCGKEAINRNRRFTQEQFLERVKGIEGLSFDKSVYKNKRESIIVTCKIHGDYKTTPDVLFKGCSCPKCKLSYGETFIENILKRFNIIYFRQQSFPGLRYKKPLKFDFYLPSYNLCIEYDGEQHYKPIEYWGGEKNYEVSQLKDNLKKDFCKKNNISLLRIRYDDKDIESTLKQSLKK